jgi:DNA-binding NarL/FixJ family response regulator
MSRAEYASGPGVRVLVVDDHPLWREALARDLVAAGHDVVGTAGTVRAAVDVALATRPDVLVLDLQLPDGSGVAVLHRLAERGLPVHVLVLTASGERDDVLDAVKAGATGYLVKSATPEELLDAVTRTAAGEAVFTPGLAGLVLGEYRRLATVPASVPTGAPRLTDRETEVLRLVATGLSSRQIAARLSLSHRTVQNHVQNTLDKLQLHNRVELTRYAVAEGLTDDDPDPPRNASRG